MVPATQWLPADTSQQAYPNRFPPPAVVVPAVTQSQQLGGLGKWHKTWHEHHRLAYRDWQAYVEYRQALKAYKAKQRQTATAERVAKAEAKPAAKAAIEPPVAPLMPALAQADARELLSQVSAIKANFDAVRRAIEFARQQQDDDDVEILLLH